MLVYGEGCQDEGRGKDNVNDDAFDYDQEGNQDYEYNQEDDGDDYEDVVYMERVGLG